MNSDQSDQPRDILKAKTNAFLTNKIGLVSSHAVSLADFSAVWTGICTAQAILSTQTEIIGLVAIGAVWLSSKYIEPLAARQLKSLMTKVEPKDAYQNLLDVLKTDNYAEMENRLKYVNLSIHGFEALDIALDKGDKKTLDLLLEKAKVSIPESIRGLDFTREREYRAHINEFLVSELSFPQAPEESIDFLLPYYKPLIFQKTNILAAAVMAGQDIEMIKKIAKHENPKKHKSLALQNASQQKNTEALAFLYPLSDPEAAQKSMLKRQKKHPSLGINPDLLNFIVSAKNDKEILSKTLAPQMENPEARPAVRRKI